jgi:hypothetical protein
MTFMYCSDSTRLAFTVTKCDKIFSGQQYKFEAEVQGFDLKQWTSALD